MSMILNEKYGGLAVMTKVFAMYLPQYHEIPENNEWWGEGFTEWTNVKSSAPLFEGHYQPRVPANGNYYDLSDPETMTKQMLLAKHYGIDGFCFYHYWFNGKQLLEKPVNMLLERENIELPFCLCWANEPWTRNWDGAVGSKVTLIGQNYGDFEDWNRHYKYLSAFFKRNEYIKIEGKPVLVIYKQEMIDVRKDILMLWNALAIEDGFSGIFVINTKRGNVSIKELYGNAFFDFEPFETLNSALPSELEMVVNSYVGNREDNAGRVYRVYDYERICQYMVRRNVINDKHYLGMCIGWDNSARRGVNSKYIFENVTPDVFKKYFKMQYNRAVQANHELMFINAWNEWAEGTYLEPDERFGLGYLEAIKAVREEDGEE